MDIAECWLLEYFLLEQLEEADISLDNRKGGL